MPTRKEPKRAKKTRPTFRALVSDPIADAGLDILRRDPDIEVVVKTDHTPDELKQAISKADALLVRSQTRVTAEVIEAAKRLKVIARAGVGVDNVDVAAATRRGVVVLNSPEGNTIAATEHTIALLLALSRRIPDAHESMRRGEWKRSKFVGVELYNKVLGIVGLGKIGAEVARRARAFGMRLLVFDPFIAAEHAERLGAELVALDDLLARADYLTIHTPLTKDTRGLIGKAGLAKAKRGLRIVNTARGGIVDEQALAEAVKAGVVAGAAIDVFEEEPPKDSPLADVEGIILTPHLGASTEEAQIKVAVDVAEQVVEVIHGRPARTAVNVSPVGAEALAALQPYITLAERIGRLQAQLAEGHVEDVEITYSGEIAELDVSAVTRSLLVGLLQPALEEPVNLVNAPLLAEQRGLKVKESKSTTAEDYASLITSRIESDPGAQVVAGTLFGRNDLRIVRLNEYRVDFEPTGYMLIADHHDRPGVIGKVGTILGNDDINIAGMHVGRRTARGKAVMVLAVDSLVPPAVMKKISRLDSMYRVVQVEL
ncbi:MAG: phosphoglycerate dehydrogenase [Armatimonadota bacterium]|nr:MAG: phosphoglycerate dehydrogenase [Armatimonadota bacterium]